MSDMYAGSNFKMGTWHTRVSSLLQQMHSFKSSSRSNSHILIPFYVQVDYSWLIQNNKSGVDSMWPNWKSANAGNSKFQSMKSTVHMYGTLRDHNSISHLASVPSSKECALLLVIKWHSSRLSNNKGVKKSSAVHLQSSPPESKQIS